MSKPLAEFMQEALVTESFKYKDNHDTTKKLEEYYDQASKSHDKFKAEFEKVKQKMDNDEKCLNLLWNLNDQIDKLNMFIALAIHMGEKRETPTENIEKIQRYFEELHTLNPKDFEKQIKGMQEIFDALMDKLNELK
jgi:uncharacterized protein YukE